MHVFTRRALMEYGLANAQVREEVSIWYTKVRLAQWNDCNAIRTDMPTADYMGNDHFVFNLKGSHYRLIAMIFFATKRLYIRGIYAQAAYSKLSKAQITNL